MKFDDVCNTEEYDMIFEVRDYVERENLPDTDELKFQRKTKGYSFDFFVEKDEESEWFAPITLQVYSFKKMTDEEVISYLESQKMDLQ